MRITIEIDTDGTESITPTGNGGSSTYRGPERGELELAQDIVERAIAVSAESEAAHLREASAQKWVDDPSDPGHAMPVKPTLGEIKNEVDSWAAHSVAVLRSLSDDPGLRDMACKALIAELNTHAEARPSEEVRLKAGQFADPVPSREDAMRVAAQGLTHHTTVGGNLNVHWPQNPPPPPYSSVSSPAFWSKPSVPEGLSPESVKEMTGDAEGADLYGTHAESKEDRRRREKRIAKIADGAHECRFIGKPSMCGVCGAPEDERAIPGTTNNRPVPGANKLVVEDLEEPEYDGPVRPIEGISEKAHDRNPGY